MSFLLFSLTEFFFFFFFFGSIESKSGLDLVKSSVKKKKKLMPGKCLSSLFDLGKESVYEGPLYLWSHQSYKHPCYIGFVSMKGFC
ncbi:hypothetical protein BY458DRAFT_219996 [Sporodiniella umbellata]|nr:hypothetical protein BY458DRAFT_219996 [Sporodiniella umbellata]